MSRCLKFSKPGKAAKADAAAEAGAAQHAHGASVAVLPAVAHGPGGSRGVNEPIGFIPVAPVVTDRQDCGVIPGHVCAGHPGLPAYGNTQLKQALFHCHGCFGYVVQVGVLMTGKGNAFVAQAYVHGPEHIVPAHGSHLLRGSETAVIAYDTAHKAGSQQGVRAL